MGPANERARAAQLLVGIIHRGLTTDQSFGNQTVTPLVSELVYGTLRHFYALERELDRCLEHSPRSKDLDLKCLMLVGAYQLRYSRIPVHAAVHETVNACRVLRKPWARSLVNAVLRRLIATPRDEASDRSFDLPEWLAERLVAEYPDEAHALAEGLLRRAPMSLRVNVRRISIAEYARMLDDRDIPHHPGWRPENLILDAPVASTALPGYADGFVSIQDAGTLFALEQLYLNLSAPSESRSPRPPTRILDACAAPGGKLFHLAETWPEAMLAGVEISASRLEYMRAEARRLGHTHVALTAGDATGLDWWSGDPFDAVLLDAPCSGTGTLRRHPEIKLLRRPDDVARYADVQARLLDTLWQTLSSSGVLVYCTCSILEEENDAVIERFLERTPEAHCDVRPLPVGRKTRHGWQLLPLPPPIDAPHLSVDGFYYARVTRLRKAG